MQGCGKKMMKVLDSDNLLNPLNCHFDIRKSEISGSLSITIRLGRTSSTSEKGIHINFLRAFCTCIY